MENTIRDKIKQADMVLVGIGDELAPVFNLQDDPLAPFAESQSYENVPEDDPILQAYRVLYDMIHAKPYFIATMNVDGLIYRAGFDESRIVAPCGDMRKMQCSRHIVEAAGIREEVLRQRDVSLARCPVCSEPLFFHTVKTEGYLEEGYLSQWEAYTRWLQYTLNHNLCILELGVGFSYPQVLRFPFEKTAYYNKKAFLIRVNSRFPQLPEELAGRGTGIKMKPRDFLLEL